MTGPDPFVRKRLLALFLLQEVSGALCAGRPYSSDRLPILPLPPDHGFLPGLWNHQALPLPSTPLAGGGLLQPSRPPGVADDSFLSSHPLGAHRPPPAPQDAAASLPDDLGPLLLHGSLSGFTNGPLLLQGRMANLSPGEHPRTLVPLALPLESGPLHPGRAEVHLLG